MKLSVVMPVYNERNTVEEIVRRVLRAPVECEKHLIIVDDASTDGTREILERIGREESETVKVFRLDRNQGKGAALREGFKHVTGDVVIIQDADLEYDPAEYPAMIAPILDGRADVVYGSRFLGGPHRVLLFWHYVGNKFLTTCANALYNVNLSDMETCYKAFRREVIAALPLRSNGFSIEPEITAKVCKGHYRLYEIPISYSGRTYAEGKKITWRDGLAALGALLRYRFCD
ncbi:MAG: glycosyltransferase family 2 protein [Planctomycetota bacterium]